MTSKSKNEVYYQALLNRDTAYDGLFFVGVKTTGVFCHASCSARKPKYENCEFYKTAEEALLVGYRPCKICKPLSYPQELPADIQVLIDHVEQDPYKKWKDYDFRQIGVTSYTARRLFKKIYGITFIEYARARRLGIAFQNFKKGSKLIDQQVLLGYESYSGFDDAFSKIMGNPQQRKDGKILYGELISTPLGNMLSLSDQHYLYLLEFMDRRALETEIDDLRKNHNYSIVFGQTEIAKKLKDELGRYFNGQLNQFSIPLYCLGTAFQKQVWAILKQLPMGTTATYKDIASTLGDVNKVRAVGNANGKNKLSILIPCHRIIKSDGTIGGYGGGVARKQYLLKLEEKWANDVENR